MKKLASWFTLERRQDIQLLLGSLAPVLIFLGLATEAQAEQWQIVGTALVQFVASTLSLVNVRGGWQVWTVLRGAVYTLGATLAPALTVLGLIDESQQGMILTGLSLTLSVLSSLLAVIVSGRQETEAVIADDPTHRLHRVALVDGPEVSMTRAQYRDYLDGLAVDADPHRGG